MTPLAYFNDIPLRYVGNIMHFYQGGGDGRFIEPLVQSFLVV